MESSHRQSHGVSHSGTTIYIYMPNDSIMLTCSRTCMESSRFRVRRVDNGPGTGPMVDVPEHSELKLYSGMETDYSNSVPDLHGASSTSQLYTPEPQERKISLVHLTREALPRLDNYRNCKSAIKRPSIGELHGEFRPYVGSVPGILAPGEGEPDPEGAKGTEEDENSHGIKLGWIQGVLIPCLLNIWGVMLFLRLSWVVGQAGIGESLLIIAISAVVCILTTLSLSAISTNGEVKGGGIYYIISRSLGPEFGASIGVVFAFANAVAASMNTIGFCNSLNDLLGNHGIKIIDGGNNDVRLIGVIAILIMVIICAVGMEWESKAQNILVIIIVGAIIDFIAGASVGPKDDLDKQSKGFTGLDLDVFKQNWPADYRFSEKVDQNFFSVFSIFFPSVTGIQAGANISGDLRDPAGAIPKGTMLALLISMFSYAVFVVFAGGAALRDASGIPDQLFNHTISDCKLNNTCQYGLLNSYSVMQTMSLWGPFIYAGCFAATLSTALTNLLSVPRLIQALGKDRIYPGLIFFSKGYGKAGEPYRGYVLTFFLSSAFVLIAELNLIAPLISNFYLASYALINFCTFHAALIKPVGWRPTFKYYNMWLSLIGFIICVAIMFLIDWITSLVTFIIIIALYLIVVYRKPDVNWGSSTQAQIYKTAINAAIRLTRVNEHVKNYRPQVLVLCGNPQDRIALLRLTNQLTKSQGLLLAAEWHEMKLPYRTKSTRIRTANAWLHEQHIRGFFSIIDGCGFEQGANALMQASGLGKLKPNVLLMGYKRNWSSCSNQDLLAYFHILHDAFDNRLAVAILRFRDGLDSSDKQEHPSIFFTPESKEFVSNLPKPTILAQGGLMHADSDLNIGPMARMDSQESFTDLDMNSTITPSNTHTQNNLSEVTKDSSKNIKGKENLGFFQKKHKNETVDVWWLYDDGGLTILLPYLITNRHNWAGCKLRIFALANRKHELEMEERNMANLLSKFRIEYTSLKLVTGITEKPSQETNNLFKSMVEKFREGTDVHPDSMITETELQILQEKTNRHLRLREMLLENSTNAGMVVMSLPMPRKGMVSAALYMAWLEILSRDMPPFLFVRGNHASVLTFYS